MSIESEFWIEGWRPHSITTMYHNFYHSAWALVTKYNWGTLDAETLVKELKGIVLNLHEHKHMREGPNLADSHVVMGRLGRNPDVRATKNGNRVITFSIATDVGFGESRDTTWYSCTLWESVSPRAFAFMERYGQKGGLWVVCGKNLKLDSYETQGDVRHAIRMEVTDLQFGPSGKKKSGDDEDSGSKWDDSPQAQRAKEAREREKNDAPLESEEVPF